jgi:predicted lipoprotein
MIKRNNIKRSQTIGVSLCLSLLVIVGCSKKDDDTIIPEEPTVSEFDRTPLLTNYSNQYIKPAYSAYYSEVSSLKNQVISFNSTLTTSSLQTLRSKWKNTLLIWQDVAFLEFGPAANISLRAQSNVYPVDTSTINTNISSGTYNLQVAANFDAKGLQAIDFLVNGTAGNDNDIVTYFTNNSNARTYLIDVVNDLESNTKTVNDAWQGSYSATFIANSASNAQGSSVSDIINAINQHYETYDRKGKIGLPAGVFNGFSQSPMPLHVEAYYSEESLPYVYRSLSSLKNFVKGSGYITSSNGTGLDDYLLFVSAKNNGQDLHTVIDNQFNAIKVELDNISDPLSNEVTVNNAGVKSVYQKMQQMVGYIKVDMTNALEVLITYQDADGD